MFRHTHATDLRTAKVVSDVIRERLGHASVETTDAIYTHLDAETMRAELASFWQLQEERRQS